MYGIIRNKHRILSKSKGHAGIKPLLCSMLEHSSVINTWFSTPKKARNPKHANHVLKTPLYTRVWGGTQTGNALQEVHMCVSMWVPSPRRGLRHPGPTSTVTFFCCSCSAFVATKPCFSLFSYVFHRTTTISIILHCQSSNFESSHPLSSR